MAGVVLRFKGREYILPEARAFEAGEAIEDIATLPEVLGWSRRPQFHRLARCFAALINLAGGDVTEKAVYAEMMAGFRAGQPDAHLAALTTLIELLMDGAPEAEGDAEGKAVAAS